MSNGYLRDFRKIKGLSAKSLANAMGISESLYEKVEYGYRNPSYGFTTKLKRIYPDVDISQLLQEATRLEMEKTNGGAT